MAILEEIEDEPPAPAPAPAPPPAPGSGVGGVVGGGGGGGGASDSDSDDEPPPLESAAQLDALNTRRKVADRVAAARSGDAGVGGGGGGGSRSGGTSTGGSMAPNASGGGGSGGVKKGFFDAPAASKNKGSSGVKKGFFDAPRAKPKPKPGAGGKAGEEEDIVFLRGKKTTTAGGKDIPDFMRVEVEGSEAAEKMKKELMDKLKPDKDTVDEVMKNQSLMSGFDDPEVMKAVDEIAKNPQAMRKYQNNPKVLAFYQQMAGMVGQRLEKMGDNSTSGV